MYGAWSVLLCFSLPKSSPFDLEGLSAGERYTRTLERWKQLSERQIAALEASDWDAFEAAVGEKAAVIDAWRAHPATQDALSRHVDEALRRRWTSLTQEIQALDARIERVLARLQQEVKEELREFEAERRAMRAYHSLPRTFTPSFHDRRY